MKPASGDSTLLRRTSGSSSSLLQVDKTTAPTPSVTATNDDIQEIFRNLEKEFESETKKEAQLAKLATLDPRRKTSWINKSIPLTDLTTPSTLGSVSLIVRKEESPLRRQSSTKELVRDESPVLEKVVSPISRTGSRNRLNLEPAPEKEPITTDVTKIKLNLQKITEAPEKRERSGSSFLRGVMRPFSPSRTLSKTNLKLESPKKEKEPSSPLSKFPIDSTDTSVTDSDAAPRAKISEEKRHDFDNMVREKIVSLLKEELKSNISPLPENLWTIITSDEIIFSENEQLYKRITNRVKILLHYLSSLHGTSDFVEKLKNFLILFVEPEKSQVNKIAKNQEGYTKITLFIQYYDEYVNWKEHRQHDKQILDVGIQAIGFTHDKKDADAVVEVLRKWDECLLMDLDNPNVENCGTPGKSVSPGRMFLNLEQRLIIKEGVFGPSDFDKRFYQNFKERISKCWCATPEGTSLKEAGIKFIIVSVQKFFSDIPDPHNITIGEAMALASPRARYILDEILSGVILRPLWRRFKLADRYLYSYMKTPMETTNSINRLLSLITDFIACERYSLPLHGHKVNRVHSFISIFEKEIIAKDKTQSKDKKVVDAICNIIGGSQKGAEEVMETLRYFNAMTALGKLIEMLQLESWNQAAATMIKGKFTTWLEKVRVDCPPLDQMAIKEYLRSFCGNEAHPDNRTLGPNHINFERLTVNRIPVRITGYEGKTPVEAQMEFFTHLFTLMYQKMGILEYDQEISKEIVQDFVVGKNQNGSFQRNLPVNLRNLLTIATVNFWGHRPFPETYPDLSGRDYLTRVKNGISVDWYVSDGRFCGTQTKVVCIYPKLKPDLESFAIDVSRPLAYITLEWSGFKRARTPGGELLWHGLERLANLIFTEHATMADISQICYALHISENIRGDKKAENPNSWPQTLFSPRSDLSNLNRGSKTVKIMEPIRNFDGKDKERNGSPEILKKREFLNKSQPLVSPGQIETPSNGLLVPIIKSASTPEQQNKDLAKNKRRSLIIENAI